MTALRSRRPLRPSTSRRKDVQSSQDYDDNRLRGAEPLDGILGGQDPVSDVADSDDADETNPERAAEPPGDELTGADIVVPVIPQRANEFLCGKCFLIYHISRMASSNGGQSICADCA